MTRDQVQSVHDDIAYMKALAQEGRQAPLLGGSILIAAGLIFGLASDRRLWHRQRDPQCRRSFMPIYGAGGADLLCGADATDPSHRQPTSANSVVNRAGGAGWMGVGLATFVMALAMTVVS